MQITDHQTLLSTLLTELARLKKIGFLVVDEAFDVARELDLDACANMPVTMMAILASERGFAQFKSRLQHEAGT
jgi:hypothetical protein